MSNTVKAQELFAELLEEIRKMVREEVVRELHKNNPTELNDRSFSKLTSNVQNNQASPKTNKDLASMLLKQISSKKQSS